MRRAGFRLIMFGVEATSDEALRILDKGFTIAEVRRAFDVLRRYRFMLGGFFIIGNIGEDARDMLRIAPFARELGLHFISLSYLRAEPASALEEVVAAHPEYHIANDSRRRVYSDRYRTPDLRRIKRAVTRDFYYHPHMLGTMERALVSGVVTPRHLARMAASAGVLLARRVLPRSLRRLVPARGGRE
jgi:radical SAM superfamily enzyme YgiQ (UPF0313 family)